MNALSAIRDLLASPSAQAGALDLALALVVSMVTAVIAAALYRLFYEQRATGSQVHRSFLLIGPAITALFLAIQFSLPLSLGLVGALTIIRFRTPIKEPEEVGFIMLVIAASIICATFRYLLLVLLLGLAVIGLLGQRYLPRLFGSRRADGLLLVALEGSVSPEAMESIVRLLRKQLSDPRLQSVSSADGLTTIHYSFTGMDALGLERMEAGLRAIAPVRRINVLYNRQGALG
jgi:hypothetical protein